MLDLHRGILEEFAEAGRLGVPDVDPMEVLRLAFKARKARQDARRHAKHQMDPVWREKQRLRKVAMRAAARSAK